MPPSSDSDLDSISSVERNLNQFNSQKQNLFSTSTTKKFNEIADSEIEECSRDLKLNQNKYICKVESCGKTFSRNTHYDRHEYSHTGVKKHICQHNDCDKSYIISSHLRRHIRAFHEKIRYERTVKCRIEHCNSMFDSLHNMEKHMLIHEKTRIFKCTQCEKKFQRKNHLRLHEITHTGNFPFYCDKCSKGFVQATHLQRHKCKNYSCDLCSKIFLKWSQLVEHKHSEHKKLHCCTKCEKSFAIKSLLKSHEECHKEKLDRDVVQCPIEGCPKYYFHQKNLNHHMKVKHEGLKHKCPVPGCKMELVTKQKLDLHIKKIHENKKIEMKKESNNKKRQNKRRKDYGIPKKSVALKLSGIIADPEIEKNILNNEIDIKISNKLMEIEKQESENEIGSGAIIQLKKKTLLD